jgi:hypothetical protein
MIMKAIRIGIVLVVTLNIVAGCRGVELDTFTGMFTTIETTSGVATVVASLSREGTCSGDIGRLSATINGQEATTSQVDTRSGGLFPSVFPDGCSIEVTTTLPYEDDGAVADINVAITSADDNDAAVEVNIAQAFRHTFIETTFASGDVVAGSNLAYTISPPFDDDVTTSSASTTRVDNGVQETSGFEVSVNSPSTFDVLIPGDALGAYTLDVGTWKDDYECAFGDYCKGYATHSQPESINVLAGD